MRSKFTRVAVFSCVHAGLSLGLMVYGMIGSSARFDGFQPPSGSELAGQIAEILVLPGFLLWTKWASTSLPNAVEWILFSGNSALWGLAVSAAFERTRLLQPRSRTARHV